MTLALALALSAHAAEWPAGETVPEAAAAHLTEAGLLKAGRLLPAVVPSEPIPIPDTGDSSSIYAYSLTGAWVAFSIDGASLRPSDGYLDVMLDGHAWLNDSADPFTLSYSVLGAGEDCDGWVDPFNFHVEVPVGLVVNPDTTVDATVMDVQVDLSLDGDDIQLSCAIGVVEQVLNAFGWSMYDLIIDLASGQIEDKIREQIPTIEESIEDALNAARVDTEVDVGGVMLDVKIDPHAITITPDGLVMVFQGSMGAQASECVAEWDPGHAVAVTSDVPAIADDPPGTEIGILLSDDLANQALYSLWRGGLLCYDLTPDSDELPIPMDTSLLGILAGDAFDELFPETAPILLRTVPRHPPEVDYAGAHDLDVIIDELGVEVFAPIDYRMAHPLAVDLTVDAGVDLELDGTTGDLAVLVDMSEDALEATVVSNEYVPAATADIEENFSETIVGLLGPLLGTALGDLAFTLPSYEGLGLATLEAEPFGAQSDWLALWATVDDVPYGGEATGCGSEGATCSSAPGRTAWLLALLGLAAVRRRR